jgi:hypothetical protein
MQKFRVDMMVDGVAVHANVEAASDVHAAFAVGISTGMTDETVEDGRVEFLVVEEIETNSH